MLDYESQMTSIFECHLHIGNMIHQHSEVYHPKEGYRSCKGVAQALILGGLRTVEKLGGLKEV